MSSLYFPKHTFSSEFYRSAWQKGIRKRHQGRLIIIFHGMAFPLARVKWNVLHPHDLAQPNEEIHHLDLNRNNDSPTNYLKLTKKEHELLHWQPKEKISDEHTDRVIGLYNSGIRTNAIHVLLKETISKNQIRRIIKRWLRKSRQGKLVAAP